MKDKQSIDSYLNNPDDLEENLNKIQPFSLSELSSQPHILLLFDILFKLKNIYIFYFV